MGKKALIILNESKLPVKQAALLRVLSVTTIIILCKNYFNYILSTNCATWFIIRMGSVLVCAAQGLI